MRAAGVLFGISSLNGNYGIGDFGKCAYDFVDTINKCGLKIWQILPLGPLGYGNSPYQTYSSFAGDEVYISLDFLKEDGLIKSELNKFEQTNKIDYDRVRSYKAHKLYEAYKNFVPDDDYFNFLKFDFVYDYAVFLTFKKHNGLRAWNSWEKCMKDWIKNKDCDLSKYEDEINYEIFVQYIFYVQWTNLKKYANDKGIKIMGDIPIYVGFDSLDVWDNQKEFLLTSRGNPKYIAGVPPDYFSKNGQRWGNPIYDWEYMRQNGFEFWLKRIEYSARLYDIIRIDHFRGFDTYWKIPARNKTARKGEWVLAPGYDLFDKIKEKIPDVEIVAEDLGDLRKEVLDLRDYYNLKGMKVLQFFYDPDENNNDFEDRNNMIVYTGTHDNQTILGWYNSKSDKVKSYIKESLKKSGFDTSNICDAFLNMCFSSVAEYAILPLQDFLGIGDEGRINIPGTLGEHNWTYKLIDIQEFIKKADYIKELVDKYDR